MENLLFPEPLWDAYRGFGFIDLVVYVPPVGCDCVILMIVYLLSVFDLRFLDLRFGLWFGLRFAVWFA